MKLRPDMYQLNTFNITKMRVSINGQMEGGRGGGGATKKTPKNAGHEINRNLTLTFKTSLENAKEIFHCHP